MEQIVVIGGGATGTAFCQRMMDKGCQVTLICEGSLSPPSLERRAEDVLNVENIWKFTNSKKNVGMFERLHNGFKEYKYQGFGGLTNHWGGGVAKLTETDLSISRTVMDQIASHYPFASKFCGQVNIWPDKLGRYLGSFPSHGVEKQNKSPNLELLRKNTEKVITGNTRQAINFTGDVGPTSKTCNNCGLCSISCFRGSLFNAVFPANQMRDFHKIKENCKVKSITRTSDGNYIVSFEERNQPVSISCNFLVLAVGPVESWRLISNLLPDEPHHHQQFKNSPVIRGIAFNARGRNAKTGFAVGQSVAKLSLGGGQNCYVSFIDGQSIPISDWLTFIPLKNRFTAWIISKLRKYFVAHMVFFSSDFCLNTITKLGNEAIIQGSHTSDFPLARDKAKKNLKEFFWTNFMIPIPFLWSLLPLGSDIHYGGTVPMNAHSGVRTDESCQLSGHPGVFLIDASWMPRIPEKPHTFTLIANAARVADDLLEIVYPGQRVPNNEKRQ